MTWFFGQFFKSTPLYVRHQNESWVEKCFYILLSEGCVAISYILNDFSSLIFGGGREAMCNSSFMCQHFFVSMKWREAQEERGKAGGRRGKSVNGGSDEELATPVPLPWFTLYT